MLHEVCGGLNVHVAPPGEAVTVYEVIAAPPVDPCSATEIVALPLLVLTPVIVGASAVDLEVTVTVAGAEVPTPLMATIESCVATPLVRPVTATGLELAVKVSPVERLVAI
jgi:hypothetical protein